MQKAGVDRCFDRAGGHVVDGDGVGGEFQGQIARQHLHRPLARAVGGEVRKGEFLVHGADVDDASLPASIQQIFNERLAREEHALEVHIHHRLVVLLGDVPEIGILFDAGIVHQNVELAVMVDRLLDQALHVLDHAQIGADAVAPVVVAVALSPMTLTPGLLDLLKRVVGSFRIGAVVHHDLRPFGRQADRDALADATAAAGHQGHLVFESSHDGRFLVVGLSRRRCVGIGTGPAMSTPV